MYWKEAGNSKSMHLPVINVTHAIDIQFTYNFFNIFISEMYSKAL